MNPLLSVIIPVYNTEKYLNLCMESIFNQTFRDYEILLIDDGSTDNSYTLCRELKARDKRVEVYKKKNGGISTARNLGLKHAKGKYVFFFDSDDFIEPNGFEKMIEGIKQNDADILVTGRILIFEENNIKTCRNLGKTVFTYKEKELGEAVYYLSEKGEFDVVWNKLYKTEVLLRNDLFFNETATTSEDLFFNAELFQNIDSIQLLDGAFYHYIHHKNASTVGRFHLNMFEIMTARYRAQKELFAKYRLNKSEHKQWLANSYISSMNVTMINLFRPKFSHHLIREMNYIKANFLRNETMKEMADQAVPFNKTDALFLKLYKTNNVWIMFIFYKLVLQMKLYFKKPYQILKRQYG